MDFLSNYEEDEEDGTEKKEEFSIPTGLPTKFGGQFISKPSQPDKELEVSENENESEDDVVEQVQESYESDANKGEEIYESFQSGGSVTEDTDSFAVKHKIPVSHQVIIRNIRSFVC